MEFTKLYRYQSEAELRSAYCLKLLRYLGAKEGGSEHLQILADYNTLAYTSGGLPRGWKALPTDDWCAEFAAGQAHVMGMTDVYPMECSCSKIIEIAEENGIWIENDNYIPVPGDWCIFAFEAPKGENTAKPDHIGTVYYTDGEIVITVEGNKGDTVATRAFLVGDARIRGYVHPDLSKLIGTLIAPRAEERPVEAVTPAVFDTLDQVPEYAREIIGALMDTGALRGLTGADGLGLTPDLVRTLVVQDRRYQQLLEQLAAAGVLAIQ